MYIHQVCTCILRQRHCVHMYIIYVSSKHIIPLQKTIDAVGVIKYHKLWLVHSKNEYLILHNSIQELGVVSTV